MILNFGKYKGCHIENILKSDAQYIMWGVKNGLIKIDSSIRKRVVENMEKIDTEAKYWGCRD